jgi:hypothetical protein
VTDRLTLSMRLITMRVVTNPAMLRWFCIPACVTLALVLGSGCSTGPATGVLTGSVPTCYGPGPDLNLTPMVSVDVRQGNRLITSGRFRSTDAVHKYRFVLPVGRYQLASSPGGKPIFATVAAGQTRQANLPIMECL